MARPVSNRNATRWTIRIIPIFIAGAVGFAKYVVIAHLCVDYIYRERHQHGLAAALITLYFVFFLLSLVTYLRTFYTAHNKPGLVPYSDKRREFDEGYRQRRKDRKGEAYDLEQGEPEWKPVDMDPDSPGLERAYSKEVFICEPDGRPRWCTLCWNWKPDRASHSTELGRCVRKMDHLCPWVGGMVSETSFNFFFQFTFYCTLWLGVCLATAGYSLRQQEKAGRSLDGRIVAIIVLAGFFCFFSIGMTLTSGKYIFENITNIDALRSTVTQNIAVRIPGFVRQSTEYKTITYPLPLPGSEEYHAQASGFTLPPRDGHSTHTFAILRTEPGENPYNLGPWRNFKSVMGNSVFEWLLPIKHSPCCNHDSMVSDYEFGPLIDELRSRYKLPGPGKFRGPGMSSGDSLS